MKENLREIFKRAVENLANSKNVRLRMEGNTLSAEGAFEPVAAAFESVIEAQFQDDDSDFRVATRMSFGGDGQFGNGRMELTDEAARIAREAIGFEIDDSPGSDEPWKPEDNGGRKPWEQDPDFWKPKP